MNAAKINGIPAGITIRVKGNGADQVAEQLAEPLRAFCSRNGSKIVITKSTPAFVIKFSKNGASSPAPVDLSAHRNSHGE